jgi:predicted RNA-binding protein with PUA-like domain
VRRTWLLKTEPGAYGIADLARDRRTIWDGVRNYQARNFLRAARRGDRVLVYHSGPQPGIAGEGRVTRAGFPDPTPHDRRSPAGNSASSPERPRWTAIEVAYAATWDPPVPLAALRRHPALRGMRSLRQPRLSVAPVTAAEWRAIRSLRGAPGRLTPPAPAAPPRSPDRRRRRGGRRGERPPSRPRP